MQGNTFSLGFLGFLKVIFFLLSQCFKFISFIVVLWTVLKHCHINHLKSVLSKKVKASFESALLSAFPAYKSTAQLWISYQRKCQSPGRQMVQVDFTKVQVDNICHSHFIYQASDFITEVYQVGQAWLSLSETMLDTSGDCLILNVPANCLQDLLTFPRVEVRLTNFLVT